MADIFDTIAIEKPKKDIFDSITLEQPKGDIFDTISTDDQPAPISGADLNKPLGFVDNNIPALGIPGIADPQDVGLLPEQKVKRSRLLELRDASGRGLARMGSAGKQLVSSFWADPANIYGLKYPKDSAIVKAETKRANKAKEEAAFLWDLSKNPALAAQNTDLASKGLNLIGETLPYITATTAGYLAVGPVGAFAVGSLVEGNSSYRTALDSGVQEDKAKMIGTGVGLVSGAIEAFGGKYAEQLMLKATAKLKNKILERGAVFGIGTIVEALEEGGQEIAQLTGEEIYRDVDWNEAVTRTLGSMAGGAFLGGVMKGGGISLRKSINAADEARGLGPRFDPEADKPTDQAQFDRDTAEMDTEQARHLQSITAERPPAEVQRLSPKDQARQDTRREILRDLPYEELAAKFRKTPTTSTFFREIYDEVIFRKQEQAAPEPTQAPETELQPFFEPEAAETLPEAVEKPPEAAAAKIADVGRYNAEAIRQGMKEGRTYEEISAAMITLKRPQTTETPPKPKSVDALVEQGRQAKAAEIAKRAGKVRFDLTTVEGRADAGTKVTARAKEIADKLGLTVSEDELFTTVAEGEHNRGTSHGDAGISMFLNKDATQEQIDRIIIHELGHTISPKKTKGLSDAHDDEVRIRQYEEEQLAKLKEIEATPQPEGAGKVEAYHGTTKQSAQAIKEKGFKPKIVNGQLYGSGVYLAPTQEAASQFGDEILPIKANINNSFVLDLDKYRTVEDWYREIQDDIETSLFDQYGNAVTIHTLDLDVKELRSLKPEATEASEAITEYLSDKGYDSLVVKEQGKTTEIVVFDPKQIELSPQQPKQPTEKVKAVKKATTKKSVELSSGLELGLDKYIAETLRPALITAYNAIKTAGRILGVIPKYSTKVFIQPSLELERKSPDAYAAVMRAVHTAQDAAKLDFKNMPLEALDMNIDQARKFFAKFTKEENYDFIVAFAGQPGTPNAVLLQQEAYNRLPDELKDRKVIAAVRQIAANNYDYLKSVVGPQVHWIPDYFYGVFESKRGVDKFWAHWTSTDKFTKKKIIPSVADAIMYSEAAERETKLRQDNYIDNLRAEYLGIARLDAMKQLKKRLLKLGAAGTKKPARKAKGKKAKLKEEQDQLRAKSEAEDDVNTIHPEDADFFITEDPEMVQPGWKGVADPVFRAAYLRPDLARLIDNLTATNKITQDKVLNAVRKANAFTRSLTFFLSAFHLKTVTLAAIADSGWGGPLLHPVRASKPFRRFPTKKNWARIQMSPEYKKLLRLGVGLGYSAEEEAYATMSKFRDYINSRNMLGATGKILELPLRIPLAFQKWQFDTYIPMLKHTANMDEWAALEKRTGKPATDSDLIDIIKATQNFYGEMNERVLGRSATQTTGSRFVAKAPGFAEGNVRTNIDAGTKFTGQRGITRGRRARAQIVNSLLVKRVIAVAGTLLLLGKWPKWPEEKEDFADLFKIDTGQVDGRGRRIMINTLDSDKDYIELWFNMFTIRPDRALYKAFNRLGGMKSTLAEFVYDGFTSMMRQDIRNWKGEKVFSLSDTPVEKLWKYTAVALERLEPISIDVFRQMRYKEISAVQSFLGSLAGVRPTWSEQDKRESEFLRKIFEQKGDLEVLDIEILSKKNPRAAYEHYNKVVDRILNSTYLPDGFKEKYGPELYRDVDIYLQNKAFSASQKSSTEEGKARSNRAVKILKHFDISPNAAEQLLKDYYNRPKTKAPYNPIESDRILGRAAKKKRLKERMD